MDGSIGEDQQDWILLSIFDTLAVVFELLEQRSKVSGATQAYHFDCGLVGLDYVLNAIYIRVLCVPIDCEAVANLVKAQVPRNATETEHWEAAIVIVRLHNLADVPKSLFILVLVILMIEVKRAHLTWIAITCCVIDGSYE